jgi:hypothetical protein
MNTSTDRRLSRILKNWITQYQPPADSRAKLLSKAVHVPRKKYSLLAFLPNPLYFDFPAYNANEMSQTMRSWLFTQSMHAGLQARA